RLAAQDVKQDAALLAEALSIPSESGDVALNLSPQKRREKNTEKLLAQLLGLSERAPVLMVFEDVQWMDPSTLELLEQTVQRVQDLRVLLIISFRPEFIPPWTGFPHVSTLTLNRLSHDQAAAMLDTISGQETLDTAVRQQVIKRTDGIPLFIEELTKAIVEQGGRCSDGVQASAIPASLNASLMARLDRLPTAKQIAQIGAVIGREFQEDLLVAIAPLSESVVRDGLDQLITAGLVFRRGEGALAYCQFKHALVHDVAYESLLRRHRGVLHGRVVTELLRLQPEVQTTQPELLAHHCIQAGLLEQAAGYLQAAGERSIAQSAIVEARAHLERGLALSGQLPDTMDRWRLEAGFHLALANVAIVKEGYGGTEVATRL